jgi:hypothetical protein
MPRHAGHSLNNRNAQIAATSPTMATKIIPKGGPPMSVPTFQATSAPSASRPAPHHEILASRFVQDEYRRRGIASPRQARTDATPMALKIRNTVEFAFAKLSHTPVLAEA